MDTLLLLSSEYTITTYNYDHSHILKLSVYSTYLFSWQTSIQGTKVSLTKKIYTFPLLCTGPQCTHMFYFSTSVFRKVQEGWGSLSHVVSAHKIELVSEVKVGWVSTGHPFSLTNTPSSPNTISSPYSEAMFSVLHACTVVQQSIKSHAINQSRNAHPWWLKKFYSAYFLLIWLHTK